MNNFNIIFTSRCSLLLCVWEICGKF